MRKPIVIIGGMGPQASLRFHELLITKSAKHHSGQGDEFPFVVHFSLPVEDFISDESKEAAAVDLLNSLTDTIDKLDPQAITLACNTAHLLRPRVGFMRRPEFVSMIDTLAVKIKADGIRCAGLLASPTTIRTKLYEKALAKQGIKTLLPQQDELPGIEVAIRSVIAGKKTKTNLKAVARFLERRGAEVILLGCTELPLLFDKTNVTVPVFDCLDVYADAVIERHYLYNED